MSRPDATTILGALHGEGVTHVFGLPGSQNIDILEALRKSPLRTVIAKHELGAAFMANGYNRAGGEVAVLATVPGPGFTYALTGLAEAWLDSAALVHLTSGPCQAPGKSFQLQAIDQPAMAAPVVKAVLSIGPDDDAAAISRRAVALAQEGEPGPVLLQRGATNAPAGATDESPDHSGTVDEVAALVNDGHRIVLFLGQGAAGAAGPVTELAEKIGAAVVTTTSGRGVVPEDHRLSLGFEMSGTQAGPLNDLLASCDLVLAFGVKFSHNGCRGFDLAIPQGKLVQVDASASVIGTNYPVRLGVVARCEDVVPALFAQVGASQGWSDEELDGWRTKGLTGSWPDEPEPIFAGKQSASDWVGALRDALPRDAIVLTDSGRHQMLVRRWFRVLAARGLIVPTNLQSMGFGIPAAIGARLAAPDRPVVAVVGDGGLLMSGLELLTAVDERIQLTVIVVNDGAYGLIKTDQLSEYGTAPSSKLSTPDLGELADTLGANYVRIDTADPRPKLRAALALPGVTLVEVRVREARAMRVVQAKGILRRLLRRG